MDALGITERIRTAGREGLFDLAARIERQFHHFKAKVPHRVMMVTRWRVFATREYATLRLNDMFILHATRQLEEVQTRFLLCGSMLFQSMLLAHQVPRGGLGFGPIYRSKDLLIGNGFIDAYEAAEKRDERLRHVCAVQLSPSFLLSMPNTKRAFQLLCFYQGRFFVHPWGLLDPQMGAFDPERIMSLLEAAGANQTKMDATRHFLENLEDYEAAMRPGSATRRTRETQGEPWDPASERKGHPPT